MMDSGKALLAAVRRAMDKQEEERRADVLDCYYKGFTWPPPCGEEVRKVSADAVARP